MNVKVAALFILFFAALTAHAVWNDPAQPAPQGNTPTPVNVGSDPQIKDGDLGVDNIGAINVEVDGYVKVGEDEASLDCNASTDGALVYDYPCLMFCIEHGDGSFSWQEFACS